MKPAGIEVAHPFYATRGAESREILGRGQKGTEGPQVGCQVAVAKIPLDTSRGPGVEGLPTLEHANNGKKG